jgi:hypothetical protein
VVVRKRQDDIEWRASGSVEMIWNCEMGQTLVETHGSTGALVDVSLTVVTVFA